MARHRKRDAVSECVQDCFVARLWHEWIVVTKGRWKAICAVQACPLGNWSLTR